MNERVRSDAPPSIAAPGAVDRWLRGQLLSKMGALRGGRLTLIDPLGEAVLGEVDDGALQVSIHVHDMRFYRAVAANGSVGAGEAFIQGWWQCDDGGGAAGDGLVRLVRLLVC